MPSLPRSLVSRVLPVIGSREASLQVRVIHRHTASLRGPGTAQSPQGASHQHLRRQGSKHRAACTQPGLLRGHTCSLLESPETRGGAIFLRVEGAPAELKRPAGACASS